ncbi:ComF family protein [Candidatus Peregrinibacteria bacterium]|jgi:ComF family protein|nr:ComF family protein [Candidatus Peregrinibacteria bacterium]MBT7736223.1 ComF family protein [Candidatus Peregrinibacteria bacterium]
MILDFLFPKMCLGCGMSGGYVCEKCFSVIRDDLGGVVNVNNGSLDKVFFCMRYKKGGLAQKLIRQFKYKYSKELKALFGQILRKKIAKCDLKADYIVPVPTSIERVNERGFNQSLLLGEEVCPRKVFDCLSREDSHCAQAGLNRYSRVRNLRGMIKLRKTVCLKGLKILLIDDVATTLSTMKECALVIKRAGAEGVCGVVIARGEC